MKKQWPFYGLIVAILLAIATSAFLLFARSNHPFGPVAEAGRDVTLSPVRPSVSKRPPPSQPPPTGEGGAGLESAPSRDITLGPLPPAVSTSLPPGLEPKIGLATSAQPGWAPWVAKDKLAPGHYGEVPVLAPTRMDWQFVVIPNSFEPSSPNLPPGYQSSDQRYELVVPQGYDPAPAHALILCVSPANTPAGWSDFQKICRDRNVIFASPHGTANDVPFVVRARITLDVLDDVRRRLAIDPDRVYLTGLSGGGRVAARLAFALPEACAGVMPICAAYSLREESWVHLRVSERLSVVLLHGETDPWRPESEREYLPILNAYHVRAKLTCYPGGHIMPPEEVLSDTFNWLEEGLQQRRALARRFPASRMDRPLSPEEWSAALVEEAQARLQSSQSARYGLLQLAGVCSRWTGLPAAGRAERILEAYDGKAGLSRRQVVHDERLRFSLLQSRAFDDHMLGPEPAGFPGSREPLWRMLEESWRETAGLARGTPCEAEAQARLDTLSKRNAPGSR